MNDGVFLHGTPKRQTVVSLLAAVLEAVEDSEGASMPCPPPAM